MLRATPNHADEDIKTPSFKGVRVPCRNLAHDRLPSQRRHDAFDRRRVFVLQMNSTSVIWRAISKQTTDIVPFSFGISENKVFSNEIDSYHLTR
jgi:hypothetical protein